MTIQRTVVDLTQNLLITNEVYAAKESFNWWMVILTLYFSGVFLIFLRSLLLVYKLKRMRRQATIGRYKGVAVINSPLIKTPFSAFNSIYINKKHLQKKEEELIIKHEINHIQEKHWIDLLCGECARTLLWFNPLIWFYIYLLKENHEYLVDRAVINSGESLTVYSAVLINQRFQGPIFSFSHSFNYPKHSNRLTMMRKKKTSPWKKYVALTVLPFIGAFVMLNASPNYIYQSIKEESGSNVYTSEYAIPTEDEQEKGKVDKELLIYHQDTLSYYLISEKNRRELFASKEDVAEILEQLKNPSLGDRPLVLINGEEAPTGLNGLKLDDVDAICVLSSPELVEKYGDKAKGGVVYISSKKINNGAGKEKMRLSGNVKGELIPLYKNGAKIERPIVSTMRADSIFIQ